jgi:hypothetical protein
MDEGTTTIVIKTEDGKLTASCWIEVVNMHRLIEFTFKTFSDISITNGFVFGGVYGNIVNNSSKTIQLTDCYITDSGSGLKIEVIDKERWQTLTPGGRASWGFDLNGVYLPVYTYEYEYQGQLYTIVKSWSLEFN